MLEIKSQSSCYFLRVLDLLVCLILPIFKFVSASQLSETNKKKSDTTNEIPGINLGNLAVVSNKCLLLPGNYESVPPVRTAVLARYVKFVRSLLNHESPEVSAVANYLVLDRGSTTGVNVYKLERETGLNVRTVSPTRVKEVLLEGQQTTPPIDSWRKPLLERLLTERRQMEVNVEDTKDISNVINSLCSS